MKKNFKVIAVLTLLIAFIFNGEVYATNEIVLDNTQNEIRVADSANQKNSEITLSSTNEIELFRNDGEIDLKQKTPTDSINLNKGKEINVLVKRIITTYKLEDVISLDSDISAERQVIVNLASKQGGVPYVWGAKRPFKAFDCSGLTSYVYEQLGYTLPRHSGDQARLGKKVSLAEAQAGDLLFFGKQGKVSHVGIYAGNYDMIHASSSKGVIYVSLKNYPMSNFLYAKNILD